MLHFKIETAFLLESTTHARFYRVFQQPLKIRVGKDQANSGHDRRARAPLVADCDKLTAS